MNPHKTNSRCFNAIHSCPYPQTVCLVGLGIWEKSARGQSSKTSQGAADCHRSRNLICIAGLMSAHILPFWGGSPLSLFAGQRFWEICVVGWDTHRPNRHNIVGRPRRKERKDATRHFGVGLRRLPGAIQLQGEPRHRLVR